MDNIANKLLISQAKITNEKEPCNTYATHSCYVVIFVCNMFSPTALMVVQVFFHPWHVAGWVCDGKNLAQAVLQKA